MGHWRRRIAVDEFSTKARAVRASVADQGKNRLMVSECQADPGHHADAPFRGERRPQVARRRFIFHSTRQRRCRGNWFGPKECLRSGSMARQPRGFGASGQAERSWSVAVCEAAYEERQRASRRCVGDAVTETTHTHTLAAISTNPAPSPRDKPTPAKTPPAKFKGTAGLETPAWPPAQSATSTHCDSDGPHRTAPAPAIGSSGIQCLKACKGPAICWRRTRP